MDRDDIIELSVGEVKVAWTNLGEGLSGELGEAGPDDVNLLRLDVYELKQPSPKAVCSEDPYWEQVECGSVCTQVVADTDLSRLVEMLGYVMERVRQPVEHGESIKAIMEELSYLPMKEHI